MEGWKGLRKGGGVDGRIEGWTEGLREGWRGWAKGGGVGRRVEGLQEGWRG